MEILHDPFGAPGRNEAPTAPLQAVGVCNRTFLPWGASYETKSLFIITQILDRSAAFRQRTGLKEEVGRKEFLHGLGLYRRKNVICSRLSGMTFSTFYVFKNKELWAYSLIWIKSWQWLAVLLVSPKETNKPTIIYRQCRNQPCSLKSVLTFQLPKTTALFSDTVCWWKASAGLA